MDAKLPIERVEEILQLATQGAKAVSEFMLKVSFALFYYLVHWSWSSQFLYCILTQKLLLKRVDVVQGRLLMVLIK